MSSEAEVIRIHEVLSGVSWPVRARAVSYVDDACVIEGGEDFGPDDLNLVRREFPGHRVTLDGDVITVWPRPRDVHPPTDEQ